jgi:molybdate transport system substrate-binding protein
VVVSIFAAAAACTGGSNSTDGQSLTVFAASSLTDVFADLGVAYERRNRGTEVDFVFGSSSELATQLEQGARGELFASADQVSMARAVDAGLVVGRPQVFARNELEIVVPRDNPGGVRELSDLADESLVVTICNPECPAGRYALEVFDTAGIAVTPDSFEAEVKGVVTRVALGEADAGIAYATDTKAASGEVQGIPVPEGVGARAEYPIARLTGENPAADRWIEFVLSPEGQETLRQFGFLAP